MGDRDKVNKGWRWRRFKEKGGSGGAASRG